MGGCARSVLFLFAGAGLSLNLFGATTADAVKVDANEDLRIAFSPDAAKKNEWSEKTDLYLRVIAGVADAKKTWGAMTSEARTAFLADLARESEESLARTHAIRELATMSPGEDPKGAGLNALAYLSMTEKDGSLRALSRNGLAARNDDRAAGILVKGLESKSVLVRDNAAVAMNAMGGPKVFEVIIEHWKEFWGAGARANVFIGQQRSYVADYDINGDSYDPVVRTVMTGICLDVKSLKVEGDIYYKTIRELAPQDLKDLKLGANPAGWEKWLDRERTQLAIDGEARRRVAKAAISEVQDE